MAAWLGLATVVTGALALVLTPSVQAGAVALTITPSSSVAGATSTYAFSFTPATAWPTGGKVVVSFPTTFTVPAAPTVTLAGGGTCLGGTPPLTVTGSAAGTTVTAVRPAGGTSCSGAALTVSIAGLTNPHVSGVTGTITLNTQTSAGGALDSASATVTITSAAFASSSLNGGSAVVGEVTTYTLQATLTNPLPASTGRLVVTWPGTYRLGTTANPMVVSPSVVGTTGSGCASGSSATTASTTVTLAWGPTQCPAGTKLSVTFTNIQNGGAVATDVVPYMTRQGTSDIDTASTTLTLLNGTLTPTLSGTSLVAGDPSTYTLAFSVTHAWQPGGYLQVTFPAEFDIGFATATLNGCTQSGSPPKATTIASQSVTGNLLSVKIVGDCIAGSPASLSIAGVTNPKVAGQQSVLAQTTTKTKDLIDAGWAKATITPGTLFQPAFDLSTLTVREAPTATVTFTPTNPWRSDGSLLVRLPSTTTTSGALAASMTGCTGSLTPTYYAANATLRLQRTGAGRADCVTGPITATVTGLLNARFADTYTVRLTTRSPDARDVDTATVDLTLDPAAMVSFAAAPASAVVGQATDYTFTLGLRNAWPLDGRVVLDLPAGFTATSPTVLASSCGSLAASVPAAGQLLLKGTGSGNCLPGTWTVRVRGLANAGIVDTYAFGVTLRNATGKALEDSTALVDLEPGQLLYPLAAPEAQAGLLGGFHVQALLATPWPANGRFVIGLPPSFPPQAGIEFLSNLGIVNASMCSQAPAAVEVDGTSLVFRNGGSACQFPQFVSVRLGNVRSPHVSGNTGNITLRTEAADGRLIDVGTFDPFVLPAEVANATVEAARASAGATTTYTASLVPLNPWPSEGHLLVALPSDSGVGNVTAVNVPGCDTGPLTATARGSTVDIQRHGPFDCIPGRAITVQFTGVRNPRQAGAYEVGLTTTTRDGRAIDHALPKLAISPGELEDLSASADDPGVDHTATYSLGFTPVNPWHDMLRVVLPAGGTFPAQPLVASVGCGARNWTVTSFDSTSMVLAAEPGPPCTGHLSLTFGPVRNPKRTGDLAVLVTTLAKRGAAYVDIDAGAAPIAVLPGPPKALVGMQSLYGAQTGATGSVMVMAADTFGNGVPGTVVHWSVAKGDARIVYPFTTAGTSGVAAAGVRSDTAGVSTIVADARGLDNSPLAMRFIAVEGFDVDAAVAAGGAAGGGAGPSAGSTSGATAAGATSAGTAGATGGPGTGATSPGGSTGGGATHLSGSATQSARAGEALTLSVQATDAKGAPADATAVTWSVVSGDATVAATPAVGATGLASLTAFHPGTVVVRAALGSQEFTFTVTVHAAALDHLQATRVGGSVQLRGYDAFGNPVDDLGAVTVDGVPCAADRCVVGPGPHTITASVAGQRVDLHVRGPAAGQAASVAQAPGAPLGLVAVALLAALAFRRRA